MSDASQITNHDSPILIAVVGPTASGKTSLSLALAERFRGEIVNCDSVGLYRGFEIGAAKPTVAERNRAPHHLIDILEPNEISTAGDYARRAREVIGDIAARGNTPIVAGGTGLYLRALLEGLFSGPPRSEELRARLREIAETKGSLHLHRVLRRLDPGAAINIHANDTPKIVRAVEVCLQARRPMSKMWQEQGRAPLSGFQVVRIGLNPDRATLYRRINERVLEMMEAGLVEETRQLSERYGYNIAPLNSTGYKQTVQFLRGQFTREQMIAAIQQAHRNYAKRQMTWFRREPELHWLSGFGDDRTIQRAAIAFASSS
jgi:tRNA dimethylallyltransferase